MCAYKIRDWIYIASIKRFSHEKKFYIEEKTKNAPGAWYLKKMIKSAKQHIWIILARCTALGRP